MYQIQRQLSSKAATCKPFLKQQQQSNVFEALQKIIDHVLHEQLFFFQSVRIFRLAFLVSINITKHPTKPFLLQSFWRWLMPSLFALQPVQFKNHAFWTAEFRPLDCRI